MSFKDLTSKQTALAAAQGVNWAWKPEKATTGNAPANSPEKPQPKT